MSLNLNQQIARQEIRLVKHATKLIARKIRSVTYKSSCVFVKQKISRSLTSPEKKRILTELFLTHQMTVIIQHDQGPGRQTLHAIIVMNNQRSAALALMVSRNSCQISTVI